MFLQRSSLIALALLLLNSPLSADDFSAAFLETGLGTRALGFGGAFSAAAEGSTAPYWNPAGLARSQGKTVQTSTQALSLDRRASSVSFALNPRGDMGFGFAWLHAGTGDIEGRTASGQRTGSIDDGSNAFLVSVGRTLGSSLSIGFTMKIFDQRIEAPFSPAATANGHGFDIGLQYRLGERTSFGAGLRNLSSALNWKVRLASQQTSSTEDALPRLLVLGIAHRPFAKALVGLDIESGDETTAHLGAEWEVSPLLSLRGGLRHLGGEDSLGQVSAGLSLRPMRRQTLQFHYAYVADPLDAGGRTTVGLELAF
ncbi:MAG: hypothetical protein ACI906_000316 [Candidatus Latescibacterota bacterium]|jgi:hypothetical protein